MTSNNWKNRNKITIYPSSQMKTKLEYLGYRVEEVSKLLYKITMFTSNLTVYFNFLSNEFRVDSEGVVGEVKYTKDIIKTIEFIYGKRI